MNTFGQNLRMTTFGESHGVALGAVVDGCPSGLPLTAADFQAELDRRKPGQSKVTTPRKEDDLCEILSGVFEGKTTGAPICVIVRNTDQRSKDYSQMAEIYRPGHADQTWAEKWGHRDYRGGGRQSGRETVSRVIGGVVAKKLLDTVGCEVYGHVAELGGIVATSFDRAQIEQNIVRCGDGAAAEQMIAAVEAAKRAHDSLGAVVKIVISKPPRSLGEPVFAKLEARLAAALMSIGTTRSFEYGVGKASAGNKGSEQNPQREGISGGISTGDDIELTVGIKPTPTIAQQQTMQTASGVDTKFTVRGRHDPCIAPRFVPVGEAMAAFVVADFLCGGVSRVEDLIK